MTMVLLATLTALLPTTKQKDIDTLLPHLWTPHVSPPEANPTAAAA
ncbi:MAG: hypothetical protein MUF20_08730 [Methylotetracoccus sp.]|nr:hypothetical protein [Methylotetracoccus sp.]